MPDSKAALRKRLQRIEQISDAYFADRISGKEFKAQMRAAVGDSMTDEQFSEYWTIKYFGDQMLGD